ncbi:glycosyltransferase family 9 protein [bacterium]|nr:glycosyltransferase family 9 protein [bacterium]
MKNILVINFGGIGDEILFLPTLMSLKKAYPNSKITLCLEPRSRGIKDLTDTIDDLILINPKGKNKYFELLKLIFKARFGKFDAVISSGGNKLIALLLFLTGIKKRYGYNTGKLSEKLLTEAVTLNKNQYASLMYHDLIRDITDIRTDVPEIKIESEDKIPNSVLIHPGVSKMSVEKNMIKTITPEIWAEVIKLLLEKGKKVILTGGPDDKEVVEKILSEVEPLNNSNFENYYGKTKSLMDLAKLITKYEKFICSDSAPLHIGVATKTRTYAIFGSTDDKKLIPQADFVTALKVNDNCPIKPCLWEHRQTTCENLSCLKFKAEDITNEILREY